MSDPPHDTRHSSLSLLSVIIPARDEEGCIASTVAHLHLELDRRGVLHEIIVVDDGSTDRTWQILQEEANRLNSAPSPEVSALRTLELGRCNNTFVKLVLPDQRTPSFP